MHVFGQIGSRLHDPHLLSGPVSGSAVGQRAGADCHLGVHVPASTVQIGQTGPLVGVGDDNEPPSLPVGPGRGLHRVLQALPEQVVIYRTVEVEPLADGTGGGEQFVSREAQRPVVTGRLIVHREPSTRSRIPSMHRRMLTACSF